MTEQEMRDADVPWPETMGALVTYIDGLVSQDHDYGTSAYAMSLAAVAAFHYVATRLGTTGFQVSFADMDVLRRTRHMKGPFMLLDGQNTLYSQYDLRDKVDEWLSSANMRSYQRKEAARLIAESPAAHPDVVLRWQQLAKED